MEGSPIRVAARVESGVRVKRKGTEKRYCYSPRTVWDREDWVSEMAKPASEGGMGCSELDWETNYYKVRETVQKMANEGLPDDMNLRF